MKRFWIVLLASAVVVAMAVPVGAAPSKCEDAPWLPGCAPSDEDPPTEVESIGVQLEAEPIWVHEAADTLRYVVTLENTTATNIDGLLVEFTASSPETRTSVNVPANGTTSLDFSRLVSGFAEADSCLAFEAAACELPATVEVYSGEALVGGDSVSTTLYPDPPCGFTSYDPDWESDTVTLDDLCIWTLPTDEHGTIKTGVWEITLRPILLPDDNLKKPLGAHVDVRDGVPGNWCTLAIGDSWGFDARWKAPYPGDLFVTGQVYLPGDEDYWDLGLGDGMCISGGAGGDYFKVGNPQSFYLRANGDVTVRWVKALP